jgi:hypothetical protein
MKFIFVCLFIFLVPLSTQAAIIINEVAWKGNDGETSDEWIELYNNGSEPVDIAGWALRRTRIDETNFDHEIMIGIDSKNPAGSFVIGAGEYVVLEKTDNNSSPVEAFFVYAGTFNLLDGGQSLSLVSHSGVMNVLYSGENWDSVVGDMDVGKTAQYTSDGWVTATATPGAPNSMTASSASAEDTEDVQQESESVPSPSPPPPSPSPTPSATRTSSSGGSKNTPKVLGVTHDSGPLSLTLISPERAYVRQEISLSAEGSGMPKAIINSLVHDWNFGDLATAHGKAVTHRFQYPGEYVIVVHGQYKDYEAYARKTITVLPTSFSITTNAVGDIQVHNDAPYEVDASLYKVVAGGTLTFPKGTIILPKATITIAKEKLQYTGNTSVVLFDDTGTLVSSFFPTLPEAVTVVSPVVQEQELVSATTAPSPVSVDAPASTLAPAPLPENFTFGSEVAVVEELAKEQKPAIPQEAPPPEKDTSQMATSSNVPNTTPKEKWPYFALLGVIGLGIAVVFAGKGTEK